MKTPKKTCVPLILFSIANCDVAIGQILVSNPSGKLPGRQSGSFVIRITSFKCEQRVCITC